jgi:SulP family sulfate permease
MVLAAFLFMHRMAEVTNVQAVTRELAEPADDGYESDPAGVRRRTVPKGVEVYEINGPFFFGAAEHFRETLSSLGGRPRVLIIRMRNVPAMDSTGLHALGEIVRRSRGEGTRVILSDVHSQPMAALGRSRLLDELGDENLLGSLDESLAAARAQLGLPPES